MKSGSFIITLLIAVLILCTACSSKSEPADNTGKSGNEGITIVDNPSGSDDGNNKTSDKVTPSPAADPDNGGQGGTQNNNNQDNNQNNGGQNGTQDNNARDKDRIYGKRSDYKPVFVFKNTGNFTDIDYSKSGFAGASNFSPDHIVGRWYEDGYTNGYYMELYGNATWQYFGEEVRNGYYEIQGNAVYLYDSLYGVSICQIYPYEDSSRGTILSVSAVPELFKTRTDSDSEAVHFLRESNSSYCDDIEGCYIAKYPLAEMAGNWYPVGDHSDQYYFQLLKIGRWAEVIEHATLEIGTLNKTGEGKFTSEGANGHQTYSFEYPGDGYMYINGDKFERRIQDGNLAPDGVVGTWRYHDQDTYGVSERGYIFRSDWTTEEYGTFIFVGDNLLLYDSNGNRIHTFWQARGFDDKDYIRDDDLDDKWDNLHYESSESDYGYIGPESGKQETGKQETKDFFRIDPGTEFFTMDTSLFGLSYNEFKKKTGRSDLAQPEDWPWWGHDMKVVYLTVGNEQFACFFQNDRFVSVYRDAATDNPGRMYSTAVSEYGTPSNEYTYWSGSQAYEWNLSDCTYQQHVEVYQGDEGHYRQQYVSYEYEE